MKYLTEDIKVKKIENLLFLYIFLIATPLILDNFFHFNLIAQGTIIYSIYTNFIHLLMPLILLFINKFKIKLNKQIFMFMIMIVIYYTSFMNGIVRNNTQLTDGFIKTFILAYGVFAFYYLASSFYINPSSLESFIKKVNYFVLFAVFVNVLLNYNLIIHGSSNLHWNRQFASFFYNKNNYGQLLIIGIICNMYLLVLLRKRTYFFSMCIVFLNIIWTNSFNSLLASIIFIVVFIIIRYKKKPVKKIAFFSFSISLLSYFIINGHFDGIFDFIKYGDITEFNGRIQLWNAGLNTVKENLFLGIGVDQQARILSELGFSVSQFHNSYIEILVAGGVLLFLIHIILFIYIFKNLIRINKRDKLNGSIFLSAIISLLFSMFFESITFFNAGYYSGMITIFYLIVPLLFINYYNQNYEITK